MEKSASNNELPLSTISIKKEQINSDIKEFAETAMNELLGWYGYGSIRDDQKRTTRPCKSQHSGSNSSDSDSPKYPDACGWCGKHVEENTGISSASTVFCSELCFSQSRRANFKKNKTCDWCRHVRNTVTYIESQDGAAQLQFCSEKCLNQYKMHIFCRETQAHLELHPHLHGADSSSGTLITPDLWLRDCKSPDSSPKNVEHLKASNTLPLITVAPPSKLMKHPIDRLDLKRQRPPKIVKKMKKHRGSSTITTPADSSNDSPQDLRVRHTPDLENQNLPTSDVTKNIHIDGVEASKLPFLPSIHQPQPHFFNSLPQNVRRPLSNVLPPPTILVPYPIILPLPIPVPIPVPIPDSFGKNDKTKTEEKSSQTDSDTTVNVSTSEHEDSAEAEEIKSRPLRKTKRLLDSKPNKVQNKNKKYATN